MPLYAVGYATQERDIIELGAALIVNAGTVSAGEYEVKKLGAHPLIQHHATGFYAGAKRQDIIFFTDSLSKVEQAMCIGKRTKSDIMEKEAKVEQIRFEQSTIKKCSIKNLEDLISEKEGQLATTPEQLRALIEERVVA